MQNLTDITLLRQWQLHQDAHAFRTLTQRYGGLVYGICNRVLKSPPDAEEITQDCFLKLAQHPEKIERSLGPWLHSVAVNAAISRIRAEQRRRMREAAHQQTRPDHTEHEADDLFAHVDEAISQLPGVQRDCVVGYFLEGRTRHDVAAALGVSTKTVQRKTDEAIDRIRKFLGQRGITTSAGALAVTMAGLKAESLPGTLTVSLGKIAVSGIQSPGVATATVNAGNKTILIGGSVVMKKFIGLLAGVLIVALACWMHWSRSGTSAVPEPDAANSVATAVVASVSPSAKSDDGALEANSKETSALDADKPHDDAPTVNGAAPALAAVAPHAYGPKPISDPTKYATITGTVEDERGRTIPDAEVRVLIIGGQSAGGDSTTTAVSDGAPVSAPRPPMPVDASSFNWADESCRYDATCDNQGNFSIDGIPWSGTALVVASAPDHERNQTACAVVPEETTEVSLRLKDARAILGEVLTPAGLPVKGALVDANGKFWEHGGQGMAPTPEALRTVTDERGYFTLWLGDEGNSGETYTGLRVKSAEHGEALFFPVAVGQDERITLTLESQWANLNGRITTSTGEAAAGHSITLAGGISLTMGGATMGGSSGDLRQATTDADGRYSFEKLPAFADYQATIRTPQGAIAAQQPIPKLVVGEDNVWNYTIAQPIVVTGEVRGADTGAPLPAISVRYTCDDAGGTGRPTQDLTQTDAEGKFAFTILSGAGNYHFVPNYQSSAISGDGHQYEKSVDLRPGEPAFVSLELPSPWSRSFRIVDQFGAPVEDVHANIMLRYGQSAIGTGRVEVTDADGYVEYTLLDPLAEAEFIFEKPGFVGDRSSGAAFQPGETLATETFILYRTANLTARLVDGDSQPVGNAPVSCDVAYGEGRTRTVKGATNQDGWLMISGELPGAEIALDIHTEFGEGDGNRARLFVQFEQLELAPDSENNLGDIPMKAGE